MMTTSLPSLAIKFTWNSSIYCLKQCFYVRFQIMEGSLEGFGNRARFSTAFHPQMNGQTERAGQTLENMLRVCVLFFKGCWDEDLRMLEFSYKNNYHASIQMTPFEALYERTCITSICIVEVGEHRLLAIRTRNGEENRK